MSNFHNISTNIKSITLANSDQSIHLLGEVLFINQNFPKSDFIVILFGTTVVMVTVVNTVVLVWVKVKDKVLIDKMVTLDCVANIMMAGVLLLAFPVRIWENVWLCTVITFVRAFSSTLNRFIPITIVFYRYLMVCHVDYCLEKGEKKIRKILLQMCLVFPVFVGSLSLFYADNMRGSVMCNGREETLRFNTKNFFEDLSYDESVFNLPFYHPYKIFALFLGYNLATWILEFLSAVLTFMIFRHNFLLALIISIGISSGLTPVVYLLGATDLGRKFIIFPKKNA